MVAGAWENTPQVAEIPRFRVHQWLADAVVAQAGRSFLWTPVALSFGIWVYFALAREPSWIAVAPLGFAGLALLWLARARPALAILACLLLGLVLAKVRADWVSAPVIRTSTAAHATTGLVEDVSPTGSGRQAIILSVESIDGFAPEVLPRQLRVSATLKQGAVKIGDRVRINALLSPLPGPVLPGGFDYGRELWFQGIGGTARAAGRIETLPAGPVPLPTSFDGALEDLRRQIGGHIRETLSGVTAAIGEAIITGERSAIPKEVNTSFQVSGLAHVLSISGLHMVLAAGGVFWAVRAILALFPTLALRYPIKKWAAAAALAAGLFYMLLAGSQVATQRSYIMIAVLFFAILVDRPAISVRNLAIAGILILLTQPESATQASFQMSFLAVMGLTAYAEAWAAWRHRRPREEKPARHWSLTLLIGLLAGLAAALMTTIVAGTMSSIPAAYHFGRLSPYSLIANGLALPVISFVIMPMALIAMIAMPLGLEHWPLWAMGKGIDLMIAISDWVAGLPGAHVIVAQQGAAAAIVTAFGAALLCLLRGPARLAGVPVMIAGILLGGAHAGPDILVAARGNMVAYRDEQGLLVPAPGAPDRFTLEKWLTANGEESTADEARTREGWTCEGKLCLAQVKDRTLAYFRGREGEAIECTGFDVVVADFPLRRACREAAVRIDRFDLWRNGAYAVSLAGGLRAASARGQQGDRPWSQQPLPRTDKYRLAIARRFDTFTAPSTEANAAP